MERYYRIKGILDEYSLFQNTAWEYGVAIGIFIVSLLILKLFHSVILARLRKLAKKTKTDFDDAILEAFAKFGSSFYIAISLLVMTRYLTVSERIMKPVSVILFLIIIKEVIGSVSRMIVYSTKLYQKRLDAEADKAHTESMMRMFRGLTIFILWCVALLLLLSNYGVDVTSLIASLGIGGLAVALALQNVLSDVFSSFYIFIDKPFQVGDYISLGADTAGTVERIGLKTTRLRTLRGEELVVPNKELSASRVQNFRKLKTRRDVFTFAVRYDTAQKKLAEVSKIVEDIITSLDGVNFLRCHLVTLGDSGLEFECVYTVDSSDYIVFSNLREQILLRINETFIKKKIGLTYPTQTIMLEK